MRQRIQNQLKFWLELFILRGPLYRLLAIALLVALIAVVAGVLTFGAGAAFSNIEEAIWWAFLRLTDPGYLGDDKGVLLRSVSAVVTVLGYVVFLGALVAIMTQWFQQTMSRLQAGLTPIVQKQHILVLGWTNRTPTIVHELFCSEGRVERFLQRFGTRRLRVVLLSEEDPGIIANELRSHLGHLWEPARFIIRSGSPQQLDHLQRVDFLRAAAILLPAAELESPLEATVDADVIKTLITIANEATDTDQDPPLVVAEIMDSRKAALARRAYNGPVEVVASDEFLSRLIAQNLRHKGLSRVYAELLGHEWGNEIYLREHPDLSGCHFGDLFELFPTAVPIGFIRGMGNQAHSTLNPSADLALEQGDRLVLVAEDYERAVPDLGTARKRPTAAHEGVSRQADQEQQRRILLLGWNYKAPALIRELDSYAKELAQIDIISRTPAADRHELMQRLGVQPQRARCQQIEADFTSASDLARFDPAAFDSILVLASDADETDASTDARAILGYLVLSELMSHAPRQPHILVELLNPDNAGLFRHKPGEVLVSPVLLSHILTQIALRRELRAVFEELFGPHGAEVCFRPLCEVVDEPRKVQFNTVQRACAARGETAIGLRLDTPHDPRGELLLNPARSRDWSASPHDEVVVISSS